MDSTPIGGQQGSRRILFGYVFNASSRQGGNNEIHGNGRNGAIVGPKTAHV